MVVCKFFQTGKCWKGRACQFQHILASDENPNRSIISERTAGKKSRSDNHSEEGRSWKAFTEYSKYDRGNYQPTRRKDERTIDSNLEKGEYRENRSTESKELERKHSPKPEKERQSRTIQRSTSNKSVKKRDFSYRDKDVRDNSQSKNKSKRSDSKTKPGSLGRNDSQELSKTETEEDSTSEESTESRVIKSTKSKCKIRKENAGKIYCICAFQSYENGMLVCTKCKSFSHADCYEVSDLNIEHVCGSCAIREKVECTNNKVKDFMMKENKTKQEHSDFAFNLMLRRSMNAILREDFKSVQPGTSPTTEFMRLRFGMSSSYASKIVLYLVQHGYIVFFGGFKMDENRIKSFLYPNHTSEIPGVEEVEDGISKHEGCKPIVKESKNGGVGVKNTKPRNPIVFSPDSLGHKELNVVINTGMEKEAVMNDQLEETLNTDKTEGEDSQDPIEGSSQMFNFTDSYSNNFKKKFIWPSRFLERESRRKDEPIDPIGVDQIGKNSKRAFFGQILESAGPRLNSIEKNGFNLVFTVGKNGESIQVWAFGEEKEIVELSKLIIQDKYMVFWNYEVFMKTSNKLPSTSEWSVKIPPRARNLATVMVTRRYEDPEKSNGEQIEKFSERFSQSVDRKPVSKKTEHSSKTKSKFKEDRSQTRMDKYLKEIDDNLALSTSSFGSERSLTPSTRDSTRSPSFTTETRRKRPIDSDTDTSVNRVSTRSSKRLASSSE